MKTFRVLALVAALGLSGCAGFTAGLKRSITGVEVTPEEQAQRGYDYGILLGNLLVAAVGYFTRTAQDKVFAKKEPPAPVQ